MRMLYSFLLAVVFLALLPYFVFQAAFKRKYLGNLRERLGLLPAGLNPEGRPAIWIHAVSVGETLAAVPLVRALKERFPDHCLVISTTTKTGQSIARSRLGGLGGADGFCHFPFDWKFSVRRTLDAIGPRLVILMESELWLNFLDECENRRIPVMVANGRISDRSFPRSKRFGFFIRPLYQRVTRFVMQSLVDARRAVELGAPADRVITGGNLKYDIDADAAKIADAAQLLKAAMALDDAPLLVAGSTHDGEEQIVLSVYQELRADPRWTNLRLLIAPRHPERFEAVARMLEDRGLQYQRRSAPGERAEIFLLDAMGELAAAYSLATVVFVGGSLAPIGGHNVLEPALFAKPIIVGPHMHNFREITQEFLKREAMIQVNQSELPGALREILADPSKAQTLGENARRAVEENRGATRRTVDVAAELLRPGSCLRFESQGE
jgi:3-deoxy-D-manno-octulosonic-acid transferase